jgi:hypothetical protein
VLVSERERSLKKEWCIAADKTRNEMKGKYVYISFLSVCSILLTKYKPAVSFNSHETENERKLKKLKRASFLQNIPHQNMNAIVCAK